jgi:hypothetical protein
MGSSSRFVQINPCIFERIILLYWYPTYMEVVNHACSKITFMEDN